MTGDPHTVAWVPMSEGVMDTACAVFGPTAVLPIRWMPGDRTPPAFRPRWRNVLTERIEREADRERRARHFVAAYANRCGGDL